jgi:hypothetical protein
MRMDSMLEDRDAGLPRRMRRIHVVSIYAEEIDHCSDSIVGDWQIRLLTKWTFARDHVIVNLIYASPFPFLSMYIHKRQSTSFQPHRYAYVST